MPPYTQPNPLRLLSLLVLMCGVVRGAENPAHDVTLTIDANHITSEFDPNRSLGAGIDGHWEGECMDMLSPSNVFQMLRAGLGPISVRLRTELAIEAWHWNPRGNWSDPHHHCGYWKSDAKPDPSAPVILSYGYKLPRRGNTLDEANDDGYSMLDDGDPSTFWKSNPYLTKPFTGEPDNRHPQWVALDFGKTVSINAIRIHWADPYAVQFAVEHASNGRVYFGGHPWNVWKCFPLGRISAGTGNDQLIRLSDHAVKARYLRIWMTEGSDTAPTSACDIRDHLGYAIREVDAGFVDATGTFHDHVTHTPGKNQTLVYTSSTDPWHRACDRDPKVEQPGVDLLFHSGVTRGLPVMLGIPVLYDTPENAAALADYVSRSGYPLSRDELGEEPDGQRVAPRDFGALYAQVAASIRKISPISKIGGPSFVTVDVDRRDDKTYRFDKRWWIRDFLGELAHRGQSGDFQFLSFEWYPFDDVDGDESSQVPKANGMLNRAMTLLHSTGLPRVPLIIGEFNYSVFPCRQEVDLSGALLNAETAAQFLCEGGDTAYYYGYEPNKLDNSSGSWGNQLMLLKSHRRGASVPVATFHAMRMLSREWLDPMGGLHRVCRLRIDLPKREKALFSAFALKRPDGSLSLLLINKDQKHALRVFPKIHRGLLTRCRLATYGSKEYHWHADGPNGRPAANASPSICSVRGDQPFEVPAWSISVLRIK